MYEKLKRYISENRAVHPNFVGLAKTILVLSPGGEVSLAKDKVKRGEIKTKINLPDRSELTKMSAKESETLLVEVLSGRSLEDAYEREFAKCGSYVLMIGIPLLYYLSQ